MTLVLSRELDTNYRVFFPLVDALRSFRVGREGHMCAPGRAKVDETLGRAGVNYFTKP